MDDIRNRLRGEWELASLTTHVGSGYPVRWDAGGQLTYDGFGNWRSHLERHEARREVLLDFSGRGIIDPAKHVIQFEDVERRADSTGALPPILGPPHPHRYVFTRSGGLTTNVLDENGHAIATLVWRRGRVTAATISGKTQWGRKGPAVPRAFGAQV
jgi:hypothetical protein